MVKLFYLLLPIIGGILAGLQAPINAGLGRKIGGFEGAFVSFFVGTLFLTFILLFFGKGQILNVFSVPKWQLFGGLLGAVFVTAVILAVPNIGVATTILGAIVGQLVIGLVIDHFGFFGVQRIPFDWNRTVGIMLMLSALFFIFRGNLSH
jgi:transporter family-2 protein